MMFRNVMIAVATALAALAVPGSPARAEEPAATPRSEEKIHYTPLKRFNIGYQVKEQFAELERVELWVTTDGGRSWKRVGADPDKKSPVGYEAARDGVYGFKTLAVDKAGLSEPEPVRGAKPDVTVVVDSTPPKVVYTGPAGDVVKPGVELGLSYTASDEFPADAPVSIEVSADRGATWSEASKGLKNTGTANVAVRGNHGDEMLVRVSARDKAGNISSDAAKRPFVIDSKPPVATITGPKTAAPGAGQLAVQYKAEDVGKAEVAEVRLYVSFDGGKTWKLAATDRKLEGQIQVPFAPAAPAASCGLFIAATDKAGNSMPEPAAGDHPAFTVAMDVTPPKVTLLSMSGGAYPGGSKQEIRWKAVDDNLAPAGITISYSADGGKEWKVIAQGLPNTGKYVWSTPAVNADNCLVRVEAADEFGAKGCAVSEAPFMIAAKAPETEAFFDSSQEVVVLPVEVKSPATGGGEEPAAAPETPPDAGHGAAAPAAGGTQTAPPAAPAAQIPAAKLDEAEQLMTERRFGDAVALLTKELIQSPDSQPALIMRARAYLGLEKAAEAVADLTKVTSANKDSREAWLQTGVAQFKLGKDAAQAGEAEKAREAFKAAVSAYENAIRVAIVEGGEGTDIEYYYCGMAYYQMFVLDGKTGPNGDSALQRLQSSLKIGGTPKNMGGTCWYIAKIYQDKGDTESAKAYWKKTAEYYPASDPASERFRRMALENYRALGGK